MMKVGQLNKETTVTIVTTICNVQNGLDKDLTD